MVEYARGDLKIVKKRPIFANFMPVYTNK